jgi:hypothetical protein
MALTSHEVSARLYARVRQDVRNNLIKPDTQLVIEGFPRSANTYASTAFWIANGKEIGCVHHLHTPVNVEVAVRRGLPVLVLLRDPLDAAVSQLQRSPRFSARGVLSEYIRFHRRVLRVADRVVVASFDTVTASYGAVISELNRRFGTEFLPYEPTAENEAKLRWEIDWTDRIHNPGEAISESSVSRPSSEREASKPRLRDDILANHRRRLERARAVHDELARRAVVIEATG